MHPNAVTSLLTNLPTILACLGGLVVMPFCWRRTRPRVVLVLIALSAKMILIAFGIYATHWISVQVAAGVPALNMARASGFLNGFMSWFHGATWALLILAALVSWHPRVAAQAEASNEPQ